MANYDDLAAKYGAQNTGAPDRYDTLAQKYNAPDPSEGGLPFNIAGFDTGITMPQGVSRFLAGTGKAMVDTGRGLGQFVGLVSRKDVEDARKLDEPLMKTGAGIAGNVLGNVGMALLPGGVLKGAGMVANAAKAPAAAQALSAAGSALLAPKSISGAATVGAGMGLVQPSASTSETLLNTGVGGLSGAALPVAVRGVQMLKSAAEPFYEGGRKQIIARTLQGVAGDDAPEVVRRLQEATAPFVGPSPDGMPMRQMAGELVPGSIPTVGQIAGNPGIAALERTASQTDPVVMNAFAKRMEQQNAARVGSLEAMAGTDGARDMFASARDAMAQQLYGDAFQTPLRQAAVRRNMQTMQALSDNPYVQEVRPIAEKLAKADGIDINSPDGSLAGMHYVKLALDDALSSGRLGRSAIGENMRRQIATTQNQLVGVMQDLSPKYATAMGEYQAASRPVNQMDTARTLLDRSVNKLTGSMQPNAYASALTDRTAAQASGFPKATLEGVFDPAQLNQLNALKDDLARSVYAQNAGRGVGSDTVQKLAYSNMMARAGVPNWLAELAPVQVLGNLASRGADMAYGRANKEIASKLAESLLNPQSAAEYLTANLNSSRIPGLLSQGGATLGMMTPGLLNFSK